MLINIGSVDSELRDDLIYCTFSQWILNEDLTERQLNKLYEALFTEQYLFFGMGETDTDSVFTRSFSVLLISLLLLANQRTPFLGSQDIVRVKDRVIQYIHEEKDYRGYVMDKGWAHSMAHIADVIDELGSSTLLSANDKFELLEAIRTIICRKNVVYFNLEDERLTSAAVTILRNESFALDQIEAWLRGFTSWDKSRIWNEEYLIISNVKNFLASFYFRLSRYDELSVYADMTKETLQGMMLEYI
ncbi:hypothetical protein D3C74_184590 [compost metagenome]